MPSINGKFGHRTIYRFAGVFASLVLYYLLSLGNVYAACVQLSNNDGIPACTADSVGECQQYVDGTECGCSSGEHCYILHYNPIGDCTYFLGVPAQWKTLEWWCYNPRENFAQMAFFRGRN